MQQRTPQSLSQDILTLVKEAIPDTKFDEPSFYQKVVSTLEGNYRPERIKESRDVTILLSDLRGFTLMSENQPAVTVINMLNDYLMKMSEIIFHYGGTIDKFMGDGVMALFGAPTSADDDLERALACAIEMQMAMEEVNQTISAIDLPPLYMGIGINTGKVVAGHLGSELHNEYTVIGDQVNLASRVEAHSLRGQILISENSYQLAKDYIEIGTTNDVFVKGKKETVRMYELLATKKPQQLHVPTREVRKSPRIEVNMPLAFHKVSGKSIEREEYQGEIIDISYGGIFAISPVALDIFSEIKITLSLSLMGQQSTDIYAKVLRVNEFHEHWECHLEFTAIEPKAQATLKEFVDRSVASS